MSDESELIAELRRLEQHIKLLAEPSKIARMVHEKLSQEGALHDVLEERFFTEGSSGGEPWTALTEGTERSRAKLGFPPSHPILRRSDALMAAVVGGDYSDDELGLYLNLHDGPAPRYTGKGHAKVKKDKHHRGAGGKFAAQTMISDYVWALNERRPFLQDPTDAELQPVLQRRDDLLEAILTAIGNGESVNKALQEA